MSLTGKIGKQYGLIIKSSNQPKKPQSTQNISKKKIEIDPKKETFKAQMKKSYDEVYESFSRKEEKHIEKDYKLLKSAGEKKLERELQNERKAQREIQAEKDKYGDKEEFVTSSYKKKMEEIKELVDKREKENVLDEQVNVTKQGNINAFYRYMYHNSDKKAVDSASNALIEGKSEAETPGPNKGLTVEEKPSTSSAHKEKDCKGNKKSSRSNDERSSGTHRSRDSRNSRERAHRRHSRRDSSLDREVRQNKQVKKKHELIDSDVRRFDENGNEIFNEKTSQYWEKFFDPSKKSEVKSKVPADPEVPEGFIRAKPRVTTDEQMAEYKARYLARKAEGIPKPDIVASDDEFDAPINDDNI